MGRGLRWTLILLATAVGLAGVINHRALARGTAADPARGHSAAASGAKHFHSEPWLHPDEVSTSRDPDTRSGDIFLTPNIGRRGGLMILNPRGQLVWFHSLVPGWGNNLHVQSYQGQPVLTWFQGDHRGHGEDVIANRSYQTVAVVRAGHGYRTDRHDFLITPQGTAWLLATRNRRANLTSVGGSRHGIVNDAVVQEVEVATGKVLWQWDAYRHIPVSASYAPASSWYDAYHMNSIQLLPGGRLLVSARNTWSVYEIDVRTGRIAWTLGGKHSSFHVSPGARFEWQHAAHLAGKTLTLFDDADAPQEEQQSSAKVIGLNFDRRTATLIHAYDHSPPLLSGSQGNAQRLHNGNLFVGWGAEPDFSEYTRSGRQIMTGSFALGVQSYRALRFHWSAHPLTRPALAASPRPHGRAIVWASWNGATGVASWRVLGGPSSSSLRPLSARPRYSFETEIRLGHRPRCVQAQALNPQGHVLGTSVVRSLAGCAREAGPAAGEARSGGAHFHSAPGLHPPTVHATSNPDLASGDIFLTPEHSFQAGPMILNSRGQLLWFHPVRFTQRFAAFNLEVQRYRGRPVLTWWRGTISGASPADVIMNSSYRIVATVRAANGDSTGEHEFQLTPRGTALIDAHVDVPANLSSVGGPSNGTVADSVVQEIDVRSGRLVWQWHAFGHVPLNASYVRPSGSTPYDYFHLNSIQQLPNHNLLISARNTSAVYEISRRTGRVIWTLGGRRSSFRIGPRASFAWQHDAHLSGGVLTVFDDSAGGRHHASQSSGKALRIHHRTMSVTLIKRYVHSPPLLTSIEGSVQTLPSRNVFVGWGGEPDFSEYTPEGRQIFNASFRFGVDSYRAFRFVWHARPLTRPDLAVARGRHGAARLWMSWDGATQVASWRVVGGSSRRRLRPLSTVPWSGFETAARMSSAPRYLAVRALDAHGRVLRTSDVRALGA